MQMGDEFFQGQYVEMFSFAFFLASGDHPLASFPPGQLEGEEEKWSLAVISNDSGPSVAR